MREFYRRKRLYLITESRCRTPGSGDRAKNHDAIYNIRTDKTESLFPEIPIRSGLVLRHQPTGGRILLTHGHQADPMSDRLWKFSRLFVRYWWRHLQMIGFHDPTSPSQNVKKRDSVEERLIDWVRESKIPLVAGHTHQPRFPGPGRPPYFNTGFRRPPALRHGARNRRRQNRTDQMVRGARPSRQAVFQEKTAGRAPRHRFLFAPSSI